jgi:hypothetical protein
VDESGGLRLEDNMGDVRADEASEARRLLAIAFETVPADLAAAGDGLLRAVGRRHARRRRARAFMLAGGATAAAGTAAAVLLSVTVTGASPALAAVTSALSRAAEQSFRMSLKVTQHSTVPEPADGLPSPLYVTGELDLKRNLGEETLSNGWRTLIVGGEAYTKLLPSQTKAYGTGGKLWTEEPLRLFELLPFKSAGARLAWDFNSDRPFNPQAVLTLLKSGANVVDEGPVSGPGWTGTRYRFTVSHPEGTWDVVDRITCTVDVDSHGDIRRLAQTTVFVASGKPGTPGEAISTLDFTFSDFGLRFSVIPPPAREVDPDSGVSVQF